MEEIISNLVGGMAQRPNQRWLMDMQQKNQMELNRQGQYLAMETWRQTNYPAQVAMLKEAGLNPSLIYSKGGAGGTTATGSGGNAGMPSTLGTRGMGIETILAMRQNKAQIELMEAQKRNVDADTAGKLGDTAPVKATMNEIIARTTNEQLKGEFIKVDTALKQLELANTPVEFEKAMKNLDEVNRGLGIRNDIDQASKDALIKINIETAIGKRLENALTDAKINLTKQEQEAISVGLAQEAEKLMQNVRGLEQKDKEIQIAKFKAITESRYKTLGQVTGRFLDEIVYDLNRISANLFLEGKPDDIREKEFQNQK